MPEVTGNAAAQVDPFDVDDIARGMHELLTADEHRAALVRAGEDNVNRFDWEDAARVLLGIVDDLGRR